MLVQRTLIIILSVLSLHALAWGEPPPVINKNVTPSARTCSELNGVFVTGEFIYWKARQEELIFASIADFDINFATGDFRFTLRPKEIDFSFEPVFRIGIGGDLPFDGWDLYLNWTRFHSLISTSIDTGQNNLIAFFGGGLGQLDGPPFLGQRAEGRWCLRFDSLDFDWGRRFYLSETLTVRPSFGGKVAWIRQDFDYAIRDMQAIIINIPGNDETFHLSNNFWGIGPYFTFDGKWTFGYGFGLFGEFSTALLWGKFDQKSKSIRNTFVPFQAVDQINRVKFQAHRVRPTIQAFVGLDWEWCFFPKWLSVNFRLGYETQYYWSQIVNPADGLEESDLTFEGLTFKGRIDF